MKRLVLLVVLAGVAGAALPAVAPAQGRRPATVQSLRAQLRLRTTELRTLIRQRNALRAALAGTTKELAKLQAHLRPDPVAVAVEQVRHEVQWAQGSITTPLGAQLVAEATLDYVVGHVSTGAYGYLELLLGEPPGGPELPPYTESVREILSDQVGICVHAERTFAKIVRTLGFRVRDVGFDFVEPNGEPDSHAADEVYYAGGWHFFDPTFGQFWTDSAGNVLSIAAVRKAGGTWHGDEASFTNLVEGPAAPAGNDTWFETDPHTIVVYVAGRRKHA